MKILRQTYHTYGARAGSIGPWLCRAALRFRASPAPAELCALHSQVEIFGGLWMMIGALAPVSGIALPPALGPMLSDGALTLWLLTIGVTPANLFALTHGANFPLDLETPPTAHAIRLAFQAVLLAMLWEMAGPTLLDFKVNMGLM